jgi:hypothetical protein
VRTHRESTASKTDTPLFISLALHPATPRNHAGFCSYLLTNEEIGTTCNPSCSARRVTTISVVITYLTQVNLLRQDGVAVAVFPFQVFQRLTNPWGTPKTAKVVEGRLICGIELWIGNRMALSAWKSDHVALPRAGGTLSPKDVAPQTLDHTRTGANPYSTSVLP